MYAHRCLALGLGLLAAAGAAEPARDLSSVSMGQQRPDGGTAPPRRTGAPCLLQVTSSGGWEVVPLAGETAPPERVVLLGSRRIVLSDRWGEYRSEELLLPGSVVSARYLGSSRTGARYELAATGTWRPTVREERHRIRDPRVGLVRIVSFSQRRLPRRTAPAEGD